MEHAQEVCPLLLISFLLFPSSWVSIIKHPSTIVHFYHAIAALASALTESILTNPCKHSTEYTYFKTPYCI